MEAHRRPWEAHGKAGGVRATPVPPTTSTAPNGGRSVAAILRLIRKDVFPRSSRRQGLLIVYEIRRKFAASTSCHVESTVTARRAPSTVSGPPSVAAVSGGHTGRDHGEVDG